MLELLNERSMSEGMVTTTKPRMKQAHCLKCGKTFRKPTQILADSALRLHTQRAHENMGFQRLSPEEKKARNNKRHQARRDALKLQQPTNGEPQAKPKFSDDPADYRRWWSKSPKGIASRHRNEARQKEARALANGGAPKLSRYSRMSAEQRENNRKYQREWTRRRKNGTTQPPQTHTITGEAQLNFCPGCGCNLKAVALGMVMATTQQTNEHHQRD